MTFQSARSSTFRLLGSIGFGNLLLGLVLLAVLANIATTAKQGRDFSGALTTETGVLKTQADALTEQTSLLREMVTGQQAIATASAESPTGGGQIKITTWKYRDPETGACITFQVTTSQLQGESLDDFQKRHFNTVRVDEALMPPDPSCP